jgi:transcriptional regulator with XRE-family HTH domain
MAKRNLQKKMTQAEYAEHLGITQSAVAKIISKGKIDGAFEKKGRRYLIDRIKADATLEAFKTSALESVMPASAPAGLPLPKTRGKIVSFAEAARREKLAKAKLLELRLKQERGELIERARVQEMAVKTGTQVRIGLEAIPSRIAPALAGMSSSRDIAIYLQKEVKAVLFDLSTMIANIDK